MIFLEKNLEEINIETIINYKKKLSPKFSDNIGGWYMIVNTCNNKKYIGKSIDLIGRLKSHTYNSTKKTKIDKAINKYGLSKFKFFKIGMYSEFGIDFNNRTLTTIIEQKIISKLNTNVPNGYNVCYYGYV